MKDKNFNPYKLESIPEFKLGPTAIQALVDEGVESKWDLLVRRPTDLAEITGQTIQDAGQMQLFIKKQMQEHGLIEPSLQTATELLERRKTLERLSTGCKEFDELVDGGIECRAITEIYGGFGIGKTQLALTTSVLVQRPKEHGGLSGKQRAGVLYIDAENTFRPERILSIVKARKLAKTDKDAQAFTDSIIVQHPQTASHQMIMIDNAQAVIKDLNIKLIVLDSGTAKFRSEYSDLKLLARRQQALNVMLGTLRTLAENNNLAVIFINQIYKSPEQFGGDIAAGGSVVAHGTTYRIHLTKAKAKVHARVTYKATMVDSPMHGKNEALYWLGDGGLEDVKKPKKDDKQDEV